MKDCILIGSKYADILQGIVFLVSVSVLFIHKLVFEDGRFSYYKLGFKKSAHQTFGTLWRDRQFFVVSANSRSWKMWLLDNLKQGFSTGMSHIWGTYAAIKISGKFDNDECGWFLLQYLIDTIIGVILSIFLSKISVFTIKKISYKIGTKWFNIGNYGDFGRNRKLFYTIWIVQLLHWSVCSLFARISCTLILLGFSKKNNVFVEWFSNLWNNSNNELLFVVLFVPMFFNSMQFIVQNLFLRWKKPIIDYNSFLLSGYSRG
jgi:hypothetical protein